jgi:FAD binding domain in molybdopterin dehydrogenase
VDGRDKPGHDEQVLERLMDALPEFRVLNPKTLAEVIAARAAHPASMPLGGGTDLVVNIRRGIVAPPVLIDMNRVPAERDRSAPADQHALPGRRAGRRAHCRPDPAKHGHGRRQSLPRHAVHLLQSE